MPKKTVDEFKAAFGSVKKPKLPKTVPGKNKDALDKAVGKDDDFAFIANIAKIEQLDRTYLVKLVAYKFAKHFDDDDKRPFWQDNVPKDVMEDALAQIVPDGMDATLTQKTFEKAVKGGQKSTILMLYERDPDNTIKFIRDQIKLYPGKDNSDQRTVWETALKGTGVNFQKESLKQALTNDEGDAAGEAGGQISFMNEAEILDVASANPKLFFSKVLMGLKESGTSFINVLKEKSLRDKLEALNPTEWAKFVDGTPMLASLRAAETAVQTKGLTKSTDIMDEMFAAVLDEDNMPLGYAATPFDSTTVIMTGFTEKTAKFRDDQKAQGIQEMPDIPATDCHHLLYVTQNMMEMYPGPKPQIHNESCPNMLMTKPLSQIPGKGLLDRTFSGNVFDESGPTGRVLFTGDNGKNSHTWLNVDGEMYDPVLGTKGADVQGAVEMTLDWVIPQRLAAGSGGLYAVQVDTPKPAANAMGFSTGYYLTDDPGKYLNEAEMTKAGLEAKPKKKRAVKERVDG